MPKRIPISAAKSIGLKYDCPQVILLAWDGEWTHIVTWGKTLEDCSQAAEGGNRLKEKWGWPESNDQPSRVRKLDEENKALRQAIPLLQAEIARLLQILTFGEVQPHRAALCYVHPPWAYFTTQALDQQRGDNWGDAGYEHNAGSPYEFDEWDAKDGKTPWRILKVCFDGPFKTPSDGFHNSRWSVRGVNARLIPWLRAEESAGDGNKAKDVIWAGTPLEEFIQKVRAAGGEVYLASRPQSANAEESQPVSNADESAKDKRES